MAQIQAGVTYIDGGQVTAANLNAHVNNAVLVPGAISTQTAAVSCTTSDALLILQSGALKQATLAQVQSTINPSLAGYLLRDGSAAMTGQLTLASATPTSTLHATPKTYVDSGLAAKQNALGYTPINKAGDSGVGALSLSGALTLPGNPAAALEATPKQYVDSGLAAKQNALGYTPLNKAGDTATGDILLGGPLSSASAAVPKNYVDTNLANGLAGKQNTLGFAPLNKAGDTATGDILLAGPLSSASAAVPKSYVDSGLAGKQANLGYTPVNKAGDSGVGAMSFAGAITLPGNPSGALNATPKQYVDGLIASRIPTGGATVSGTYLFSDRLQSAAAPTSGNDVLNKTFFDSFINSIPTICASAYFNTAVPNASVSSKQFYLTVLGTRSVGSSVFTINYGSLDARYNNSAMPFFLEGQYIGVDSGTTGITGKLYRINSVNSSAKTFTISTTETTAFNTTIALSLVFDSTLNNESFNVKSIYLDATAVSKYYVNYSRDKSGNATPIISAIKTYQVSGSANTYTTSAFSYGGYAIACRDCGRTTYNTNGASPEGFGATNMGAHIGFFYNGTNGLDYTAVYAASFEITSFNY